MALGNGVKMKFTFIPPTPPGGCLMGSPADELERRDDEVQHCVTLKGFYLGAHPVTQAQWEAAMGTAPSKFKGDVLPVDSVSWHDCVQFCEKLGQKTGKQFRLPTEAEWEYACRAGTTTPFWFGQTISTGVANYNGGSTYGNGEPGKYRGKTTLVNKFGPNPWGLHDLHGNVWEWCNDWYGPIDQSDDENPVGPNSGKYRVLRGGSWYDDPEDCRAAFRLRYDPADRDIGVGCRVLLCLE